jgi:hypothetical protein
MEIHHTRRLSIDLRDEEIETIREILCLAHAHLKASPCVQLSGTPLQRQAGLCGPELFRVKSMIEKMGTAMGVALPYDDTPTDFPVATL